MNTVKKRDPWGNWIPIYCAQQGNDALAFYNHHNGGRDKDLLRIDQQ